MGIEADKIAHFIMFFPFPFSAWFAFSSIIKKITKKHAYLLLFFTGIAVASTTELLQSFIPTRDSDWLDLMANYTAIFLGTLLVMVIDKYARNVWPGRL